ncbi:MFS transporter [Amycolatopsis magusensis]|uniref:MFS transporter n=1 Tax=Amycolatopsis magusensis TaxID=882444 RepID=UPI0037BB7D93
MTDTLAPGRGVLWTREHRVTTTGILLVITLVAFENMGVATAMPTMVAELDGTALYSWPFAAFMVSSVVATVLSGRLGDARGPKLGLLTGPLLFLAGLVVAGTAVTMPMLLLGRVLQGFGSGLVLVAVSLLIGLVFTDRERPVIYAANAAAWVLPGVIGPSIAGLVTERFGWRWVFLALIPLVGVAVVLLLSVVRRLEPHVPGERERRAGVPSAVVVAIGIAALTWAAQHPSPVALVYGLVGAVALVLSLRRLLPPGTLTLRAGLPTVVAARALLSGAFFGMEAFLPLTLSSVHGYSPAAAGLPLTVTALGWSAASMLQGRYPDWSREFLLRTGFALVAAGVGMFVFVAQPWAPSWLAFACTAIGGAGMGLAMPSVSLLLLRFSPVAERGFTMSASQLGDWVGSALTVGFGGVLLTALGTAERPSAAMAVVGASMAGVALIGFAATRRWPSQG